MGRNSIKKDVNLIFPNPELETVANVSTSINLWESCASFTHNYSELPLNGSPKIRLHLEKNVTCLSNAMNQSQLQRSKPLGEEALCSLGTPVITEGTKQKELGIFTTSFPLSPSLSHPRLLNPSYLLYFQSLQLEKSATYQDFSISMHAGLINTHVHTSQQLGRGIADDVDLLTWLHERIWPYEAALTEEDSYLSTLLCGVELIRSGVTCFAEAGGQHVPGMVAAVTELGLRACLCPSIMDSGEGLPEAWAKSNADSCIQLQEDLYYKYNGTADGRIRSWFGLRQILNATDDLLLRTKASADRLNTGIHMHVAEIPFENEHVVATRGVEHGTVTYLGEIGLLGSNLLAAHSVWINDHEVDLFASFKVNACHCPGAAMHMLGFSPVEEMLKRGVNVSLGTDGAPSNNRMSLVDEMYLAALIHKGKRAYTHGTTDPTALPAEKILQMATINGARTCLWEKEIGSLEIGKKADLVVIDPHNFAMTPLHDPIANLVYSMRTENIESVMCNGRWLMRNRTILTVNEASVLEKAAKAAKAVVERAGIKLPQRMSVVDIDPQL